MFPRKIKVCDAFGIPVYLDFTLLILLFIFVSDMGSLSLGIACALMLGLSITAHELGHALTARAFGYKTRDITLSLIGGCASLIALPRKAYQEFLTAAAGPAVSFAISGLAYLVLCVFPIRDEYTCTLLLYACFMNLMLGSFNLLPGFPMDGGRIFRSVARIFTSRANATYWAMIVGRVSAVALVVLPAFGVNHIWFIPIGGLFFMRLLIAWMIWRVGYSEYKMALFEENASGWTDDFKARVSPPPYGGDESETEIRKN